MNPSKEENTFEISAPLTLKVRQSTTDAPCALIFIVAVLSFLLIGVYSFVKGNISYIGVPIDYDEKACGISDGYEDFKFLYYPIPFSENVDKMVCVKRCPGLDALTLTLECKPNGAFPSCQVDNIIKPNASEGDLQTAKNSHFNLYNTTIVEERVCLPVEEGLTIGNPLGGHHTLYNVKRGWLIVLATACLAFALGIPYMFLLQLSPKVVTLVSLLGFLSFWGLLGAYFKYKYDQLSVLEKLVVGWNYSFLYQMSWAIGLGYFATTIFLKNKLLMAVRLFEISASFIKENRKALLVPLIFSCSLIVFWAFWISSLLSIVTIGSLRFDEKGARLSDAYISRMTDTTFYLFLYQLLSGIWINTFLQSVPQFVTSSSCSIWFFDGNSVQNPLSESIKRALRYHFGSLALGSLLLGLFKSLRTILKLIYSCCFQDKEKTDCSLLRCLKCFCWNSFMQLYLNILIHLDRKAFAQMAIKGNDFCSAKREAWDSIKKRSQDIADVAGIGDTLTFIGRIFITASSTTSGIFLIYNISPYTEDLNGSTWILVGLLLLISYSIGTIIMSLHGMAADTILLCFVVEFDIIVNGGFDSQKGHLKFLERLKRIILIAAKPDEKV